MSQVHGEQATRAIRKELEHKPPSRLHQDEATEYTIEDVVLYRIAIVRGYLS